MPPLQQPKSKFLFSCIQFLKELFILSKLEMNWIVLSEFTYQQTSHNSKSK